MNSKNVILKYLPAVKQFKAIELAVLNEDDFNESLFNKIVLFLNTLKEEHLLDHNLAKEMYNGLDDEKSDLSKMKADKLVANKFYRLQSIFKNPQSQATQLIEWQLNNLNNFDAILNGFENEDLNPDDLEKLFEPKNLVISVVFYPDFSYLGPKRLIIKKETDKPKVQGTVYTKKFILQSDHFKLWPIIMNVEFSTQLTEKNKDDPNAVRHCSCMFKNSSNGKSSMSIKVFPKISDETRINNNYKKYYPEGAKTFLQAGYGGLFMNLPKSNAGEGNKDPRKSAPTVKYYMNPDILRGFNQETKKFENELINVVEYDDYESNFILTDVNNLNKFSFAAGSCQFKPINLDLSKSIEELDLDLCKHLETQHKFDDLEMFLNSNTGKTIEDLLEDQAYAISKKKSKSDKLTVLKKYTNNRLFINRLEPTDHQTNFLLTCYLQYIHLDKFDKKSNAKSSPVFNFEIESLINTGYSNIPYKE